MRQEVSTGASSLFETWSAHVKAHLSLVAFTSLLRQFAGVRAMHGQQSKPELKPTLLSWPKNTTDSRQPSWGQQIWIRSMCQSLTCQTSTSMPSCEEHS